MKTISTDILIHEPMAEYQAKRNKFLTSHRLADYRRCPLLFHKKELGLVVEGDRPAFQLGRAAHTLILEGRDLRTWSFSPPITSTASTTFSSDD